MSAFAEVVCLSRQHYCFAFYLKKLIYLGFDNPDKADSDFELWEPSDIKYVGCIVVMPRPR